VQWSSAGSDDFIGRGLRKVNLDPYEVARFTRAGFSSADVAARTTAANYHRKEQKEGRRGLAFR